MSLINAKPLKLSSKTEWTIKLDSSTTADATVFGTTAKTWATTGTYLGGAVGSGWPSGTRIPSGSWTTFGTSTWDEDYLTREQLKLIREAVYDEVMARR